MNFIKSPLGFKITTRSPFLLICFASLAWLGQLYSMFCARCYDYLCWTSQTAFFFAIWPYFSVVLVYRTQNFERVKQALLSESVSSS
jgi:hypothetical protein